MKLSNFSKPMVATPVSAHNIHKDAATPMIPYFIVLFSGALSAMAASIGGSILSVGPAPIRNVQEAIQILSVWDDTKLRLVCICGSVGGALLSVCIFPSRRPRLMLGKFFTSGLAGIMFSPWLAAKLGVSFETDAMLGWSGLVALCSYTAIQKIVVPLVEKALSKWLGLKLGVEPDVPTEKLEP